MRNSLSHPYPRPRRAWLASAVVVALVVGAFATGSRSASASDSPVTAFAVTTNFDGLTIPNGVDASANNGEVATNDVVGFSWSFVTARQLTNAVMTQSLPAGWSWDPAATGVLTATLPAYQSTAVISPDGRTITATLSASSGADITLGPLRAVPSTAADGSVYTPQVDISDGGGSDSATTSAIAVVSGSPQYTVTAMRSQTVSSPTTRLGVLGQAALVRITLDVSAYLGQPNIPLPAGSQFQLTISNNIADPQLSGQSGPVGNPASHANRVTTFTTTSDIAPGSVAQATVSYFWANTVLPSSNTTISYTYAPVSVAGFVATPSSTFTSFQNITAGSAPGQGSWTLFGCSDGGWSSCPTSLITSNQEPNPTIALDARLLHVVNYRGALDVNNQSVPEASVRLTSQWNGNQLRAATEHPLAVRVSTNGTTRVLAESEYTLRYFAAGAWTAVASWSGVPTNATSIEVTVVDPWAAGATSPNVFMRVPLVGVRTTPVAGSITGGTVSPSVNFARTRLFRMVAVADSATFTVDSSSVTAPTTLRYTGRVNLDLPASGVAVQSTPGISVTQTFPTSVLDVVPVALDPSWTFAKSFDASGRIVATFTHGPVDIPATLPPLTVDATLSPVAPPSGSVTASMAWVVQRGTSSLSAPTALTATTLVSQAQVIALTASAAQRTVEVGETPLAWTVGWSNFKAVSQGLTYVVGVLPSSGDAFGSSFHGSIEFGDVGLCSSAAGAALQYTTDAGVASRAADDPTTSWTPVSASSLSGLGATAFRVVIPDFLPGSSCTLSLSTPAVGNVESDRYAMSIFGTSAVGGSLPRTVPTEVDVVAGSVSGRIVEDPTASGVYTAAMTGFSDVTVELLTAAGAVLRSTTTAADGSYVFDGVVSGQYRLRVDASGLPTGVAATFSPALPFTLGTDEDLVSAHFGYIVYVPGIAVSQSHALPTAVAAGQTLDLTYVATNTGNGTLSSVAFTGIALGTPNYTWPSVAGRLTPGQSVTVRIAHVLTQAEIDAGVVVSSFAARGVDPVSQAVSASSTESVPFVARAELSVTKAGSFTGLSIVGAPVNWTIEVINSGAVTLSEVAVADALAGLSPLTYTWPSGGSAGVLAPGHKVTVTASSPLSSAQVAAGSVTNTASASAITPHGVAVAPPPATSTVALPTGSIAGRVVDDPTASGAPSAALAGFAGVTVELRDNGGAVLLSTTTTSTGAYRFSGLPAGSYSIHPITSTLPIGSAPTFATALVIALVADQEVASADFGFIVYRPQVTLSQTAVLPAAIVEGEVVTVRYVVTNSGNGALSSVAIAGMVAGTATTVWPGAAGALDVGESVTVTVEHVLADADIDDGSLLSEFSASGIDPVGQSTSGSSVVAIPLTGAPSLSVTASGTHSGLAAAGSLVSWTFHVTNTGTVTVSDVSIAGTAPGLTALEYVWPGTPGRLAPGQSATATATSSVTAAQASTSLVANGVTASGRTRQDAPVTSPPVTASVTLPSGSVTGRVVDDAAASGSPDAAMTGLAGVRLELYSHAGALLDTTATTTGGSYTFRGLPAGDYDIRVDISTLPVGAFATFAPTAPATVADATATAGVDFGFIRYVPVLTVTQTPELPSSVAAGEPVTITYRISNDGNAPLTGVSVEGALLASGAPLESWPGTRGDLAVGESATITVSVILTQEQVDSGSFVSALSAAAVDPVGQSADHASSVEITLPATARLAVSTSGAFTGLTVLGAEVPWTMTVTNTGAVTMTEVTVAASLDGISALAYAWPRASAAGVLAPGESAIVTGASALTADQIAALAVTNAATASGSTPSGSRVVSDPASATVYVERAEGVSLSLTSSLPSASTPPGPTITVDTPITWTYTVINTGRGPVSTIRLVDSTGGAPTLVSPPGFSGVLNPGESVIFESTTLARSGDQRVDATVTATVDSEGTPLPAALSTALTVTVSATATAYYTGASAIHDRSGGEGGLAGTGLDLTADGLGGLVLLVLGVWLVSARRRRAGFARR